MTDYRALAGLQDGTLTVSGVFDNKPPKREITVMFTPNDGRVLTQADADALVGKPFSVTPDEWDFTLSGTVVAAECVDESSLRLTWEVEI